MLSDNKNMYQKIMYLEAKAHGLCAECPIKGQEISCFCLQVCKQYTYADLKQLENEEE